MNLRLTIKIEKNSTRPTDRLLTHSQVELEAQFVEDAQALLTSVPKVSQYMAIDDAQFFDEEIIDVCLNLADKEKYLLIAGLNLDFWGNLLAQRPGC